MFTFEILIYQSVYMVYNVYKSFSWKVNESEGKTWIDKHLKVYHWRNKLIT